MSGISFTGLGSGMPVKDIVTGLVNAEAAPFQARLQKKEADYTANISANGSLKSGLQDLTAALDKLKSADNFQLRKASGNDDFVGITSDKDAEVGSYDIKVNNLAQAYKAMTNTFIDDLAVGAGKLTFQTAENIATNTANAATNAADPDANLPTELKAFSIDVSDTDTLSDIRDKINEAPDNDQLIATIVTEDNGEQRLVMTAKKTGLDNAITISGTQADGSTALAPASRLNDLLSTNLTELKPALDASITIDGAITLTSATNTFKNSIEGITLTAKKAHGVDDSDSSVAIAEDNNLVETELKKFVAAYNSFAELADKLGKADPKGGSGALVGDSMLRGITSRLRRELSSSFDSGNGQQLSLSQLGVSSDRYGKLEFDSSKLKDTLKDNPGAVQQFFVGTEAKAAVAAEGGNPAQSAVLANPGFASSLDSMLNNYTKSDGFISSRIEGYEKQIESLDKDAEDFNAKMKKYEARLYAQYNAMDMLVASMTSTSNYLMGQLDSMPGVVRKTR